MCLYCFSFKSLSWNVCGSNPKSLTFKFIKILGQIMNIFSKSRQHENSLIHAEMVKILW